MVEELIGNAFHGELTVAKLMERLTPTSTDSPNQFLSVKSYLVVRFALALSFREG